MNNWQKIVVSPEVSILDAMKIIDGAGTQFVMVLDETKKLLGVVTDGDVRRGILNNVSLSAPVAEIMNTHPRYLSDSVSRSEAISFLSEKRIAHVPLLDALGRVTSLVSIDERVALVEKHRTAVLMVGGLGSRLGELTTNCPKPMLPLGGRPVLEIIIENLKDHGFKNFIFCVNFKADVIQSHFGNGAEFGINIVYVHENKRMGTAGALSLIPMDTDGPLLVMNGDIVTKVNFSKLMEFHEEKEAAVTAAVRKYDFQIPFGVVKSENGQIKGIEEKPNYNFMVSAGINVIEKDCLGLLPPGEFFDMPQLIEAVIASKRVAQAFPIHEYWLDIGRMDDLERAHADMSSFEKGKQL